MLIARMPKDVGKKWQKCHVGSWVHGFMALDPYRYDSIRIRFPYSGDAHSLSFIYSSILMSEREAFDPSMSEKFVEFVGLPHSDVLLDCEWRAHLRSSEMAQRCLYCLSKKVHSWIPGLFVSCLKWIMLLTSLRSQVAVRRRSFPKRRWLPLANRRMPQGIPCCHGSSGTTRIIMRILIMVHAFSFLVAAIIFCSVLFFVFFHTLILLA